MVKVDASEYPFVRGDFRITKEISKGSYKVVSYLSSLSENEDTKKEYIMITNKGNTLKVGAVYHIEARMATGKIGIYSKQLLCFKIAEVRRRTGKVDTLIHESFLPTWDLVDYKGNRFNSPVKNSNLLYRKEEIEDKYLEVIEVWVKTNVHMDKERLIEEVSLVSVNLKLEKGKPFAEIINGELIDPRKLVI